MLKSLISKGLNVPHRCENRYIPDWDIIIKTPKRINPLLLPIFPIREVLFEAREVNLIQETLSVLDRETAVLVEQALS